MNNGSPSILLINAHSSQNAGDLALVEMALAQMRAAFDHPQITVAANWPSEPYFQAEEGFRTVASVWDLAGLTAQAPVWKQILRAVWGTLLALLFRAGFRNLAPSGWSRLFEAYRQADLVAAVSGNQLYSTGRYGWPLPLKILMVGLAHLFGKPFYVLPQSIGPLRWGWERVLVRASYARARGVFLRDELSLRLAKTIGLPPGRTRFGQDPAFAFPPAGLDQALAVLRRHGFDGSRPALGLTLITWQGKWLAQETMRRYITSLANLLRRFAQAYGAQIYLFNQVSGPTPLDDDRLAGAALIRALGQDAPWLTWVDEPLSPGLLKACYGCMDLFIASRLHSGIFALGMQVPVVFIGYLSKTRGMMQSLGLEDWVIDLDQVDEKILWEKVQAAWQERAARAERLAALIPEVVGQVREVEAWIREDYAAIQS